MSEPTSKYLRVSYGNTDCEECVYYLIDGEKGSKCAWGSAGLLSEAAEKEATCVDETPEKPNRYFIFVERTPANIVKYAKEKIGG